MLWETDEMESNYQIGCVWESNFTYSGWSRRSDLEPEDFNSEWGWVCPTCLMNLMLLRAALCGCCSVTGDILSQFDRESVERTQVQSQQQLTQYQLYLNCILERLWNQLVAELRKDLTRSVHRLWEDEECVCSILPFPWLRQTQLLLSWPSLPTPPPVEMKANSQLKQWLDALQLEK